MIQNIKNTLVTILELAHIRLEMACLEISEQKERLLVAMIYILLATFFIFTAFISLLFGLNAFLESTESKISAFFIITVVFLLLALTMVFFVVKFFKKQAFLSDTVSEIKQDIKALKEIINQPRDTLI
ncbi:phage holin family protein [Campylobacter curvus]|uniref:phage holin family protein n=1 Tax=Campylobacter curvus TaxID=200 RepID=UPI0032D5B13C